MRIPTATTGGEAMSQPDATTIDDAHLDEGPSPVAATSAPPMPQLPDVDDLPGGLHAALEAIIMVVDEPISTVALATAARRPVDDVETVLRELAAEYRGVAGGRPRGFELREVAQGWRIYSAPAFHDLVGTYVLDGQTARLTQAALETLAIIAYRQPVTRGQVSAVRGVNVDGVVRTLSARGLIAEIGADPSTGALRYGTTGYFLERMGLGSLDELPALAPNLPDIDTLGADDEEIR